MIHKEFFGMLFLLFVGWVFISGTPNERIDNFCRPIGWTGNAVTSLSALAIPSQQETVKGWFDKFQYGCRYMTWRLFYQDEYNKFIKAKGLSPAPEKATVPAAGAEQAASAASAASAANNVGSPAPAAGGK
jgi:hypothetical protein